ncbi:MAG: T9SS type A sorting domain-containing protein, partial [Bacteroidia bacterium]
PNNFTARQNCLVASTGTGSLVFNGLNTIGENFTQTGGTASYALGNTIFMNGTIAQTIDVAGPMEGLTISNTSSGVSLLRNLQFNDTLSLLTGNFTSGVFTLTAANAAAISRTNGTLATVPNFIGNNDIIYRAAVTSGAELPTATTIMRNLSLLLASSGTVIQNAPARVNGNLLLGLGYLQTSTANMLFIADNATSSGASNNSFVSGPMRKIGNDGFIFPVGKNAYYAAIAISAPANNTSEFTAEYFFTDPDPFYNVASHDPTLVGISRCEYWILDRTTGVDAVSVTLSWDTTECGSNYITVPSDLRVARWDAGSSIWRDEGNGGITGGLPTGTIISGAAVVNFSPFTLATVNPINPLPVELLYFDARIVDQHVALRWETATEQHSDYFTIQRSRDGLTFEDVLQVDAAGFSTQRIVYTENDLRPYTGTSYYRIVQTDFNGVSHTYSPVPVTFENNTPQLTTQYTTEGVLVLVNGFDDETLVEVTLYDATGRIYLQQIMRNTQFLQLPNTLATGIYFLRANSNDVSLNENVFVR